MAGSDMKNINIFKTLGKRKINDKNARQTNLDFPSFFGHHKGANGLS